MSKPDPDYLARLAYVARFADLDADTPEGRAQCKELFGEWHLLPPTEKRAWRRVAEAMRNELAK